MRLGEVGKVDVREVSLLLYVCWEWTVTPLSSDRATSLFLLRAALGQAPRLQEALYSPVPKSLHDTKEDTLSTTLMNFRMA